MNFDFIVRNQTDEGLLNALEKLEPYSQKWITIRTEILRRMAERREA